MNVTRILIAALIAAAAAVLTIGCASAPTKPAGIADIGAKVESSAATLLQEAQTAQMAGLISRAQLDVVAIAVDKIGHLGLFLESGLRDYRAIQTAGGDTTGQAAAIAQTISDITAALSDLGKQVPSGAVQSIDQAVANILGIIAQVKAGMLL